MSSVFRYNHWCFSARHHDSMSELERDVGHSEESFEEPGFDQLIDGAVEVFDPTVSEYGWSFIDQSTRGAE